MIKFGVFSKDLSKFIVTQEDQTLFVDIDKSLEVDLDEQEEISDIHNIIATEEKFLILANKRHHRVGLYLLVVDMNNPQDVQMLLNVETKLLIADTDMHLQILMDPNEKIEPQVSHKRVIVCFKCIDINTYNVLIIDLCGGIQYWHES